MKFFTNTSLFAVTLVAAAGLASCQNTQAQTIKPERPKKIFAHYMGPWPVASGPLVSNFQEIKDLNLRHDQPGETEQMGGHIRNWSLPSPDERLSLYDSIDLEIRRALRIGIDGFTVDAWAGGQSAKDALDMMFKVAEEKDYPFEITVTPDPNSLGDETLVDTVKYLLDKHGKSPKLARRDGKPLIFGYQSIWIAVTHADDAYNDHPELKGTLIYNEPEWRYTPKGWDYMGKAMKTFEKKVGQPLYMQFAMEAMEHGVKEGGSFDDGNKVEAAGIIAKYVGAVGSWSWLGPKQSEIADAVKKAGAEWMRPIGFGQKENIPTESFGPPGLEWFIGDWKDEGGVIDSDSTLLQYITWNDYGENSALAPAFNTRYALFDLTEYFISWWKKGKPPVYDHDKMYLAYHKYPKGAKIYPFKGKFPRDKAPALEVVTILTKPATIRLPGRSEDGKPIEYSAPAGFFTKQFPNTPGEVVAEIVRGGKAVTKIQSPEPITDKPFREDNGFVAWSTEEERHWKADFGDKPMWTYSEYGDEDKDGLPNWFEMYWFGSWMDFSTQTIADPNADPDRDGKTNLQEWQEQTDPMLSPAEEQLIGKFPLEYLKNRARGANFQIGKATLPFPNGDFEEAGATPETAAGWTFKGGALRSREKVSSGKWALKLPGYAEDEKDMSLALQSMGSGLGYSWNSSALNPYAVRAGSVVSYAVDVASGADGVLRNGYMRMANDPYAHGSEMWGIPIISTDKAQYSRRTITSLLNATHVTNITNARPAGSMGGIWGNQIPGGGDRTTALYLDNFSPVTFLRPQLKISDVSPLQLKTTAPNTPATSTAISISNAQIETLSRQLQADEAPQQIATILYGVATLARDDKAGFNQIINGTTDDVGAIIIGKNAELFEFVSNHLGATPQQLKLLGADEKPGLIGGPNPEIEEIKIRFKGAPQPGEYSATLRIVTQAANTGTLSLLEPGEPPYNLFYTDIPVSVTVG